MTKTTGRKNSKRRFSTPNMDVLGKLGSKHFVIHILASLALVPMAIALWAALPTFQVENSSKIYKFGSIQLFKTTDSETGETSITRRVGFDEAFDLQGGASFNFEIVKEQKPIESNGEESQNNQGTTPTPTPEPEFIDPSTEDFEKTISIIRKRIDSLNAVENQVFKYSNDSKFGAIINMSSSREEAGIIPYYLSLQGKDIQIWVDDPNYKASETSSFSLLDGLTPTELTRDDIAFAQSVNDQNTYGNGIRLVFKKSAYQKFYTAATKVTSRGFALIIDGQPVAYQSAQINLQSQDTGIVYLTNPFGANGRESYEAIASVINTEPTPLKVSVISNNNVDSFVDINLGRAKLGLFITFVIINIGLFITFRSKAILVSLMNVNTLILSIGAYKIVGMPLNMNLIWGTMIGVVIILLMGLMLVRELTNGTHKSIDSMKEVSNRYRSNFRNILIILIIVVAIVEILDVTFTYQLQIGIGVSLLAGLTTLWTVTRAFVNELFIIPLQSDGKKR